MTPTNTHPARRTLDRAPIAEARSVRALVRDVLEGRVRISGWQRPIRWEVDDARKLIDSLYRGYPVGTLLFWRREGPAEEVRLGTTSITAPPRTDALYVVDGQQRITSLVRVLAHSSEAPDPFALFFDLTRKQIVTPPREGPDPAWLPLDEAFDSRRLIKWLIEHPGVDQEAAIELGARIREYQIPSYIVESDSESAVREIFERTNNTGKQLDANEVFDARFRGFHSGQPSRLQDVAEALVSEGLGRVDHEQLHKMMLAMRFTDPSKADPSGWSAEEAHGVVAALQQAARRALTFLAHDAGIPHLRLLPYAQPLLALTRFFDLHPIPHARNRILLARWLWRGAAAALRGGVTVKTRATLQAIDGAEDESVQRLLRLVEEGRHSDFEPGAEEFLARSARSTLCTLALARLDPKHLLTGEPVALDDAAAIQISQSARGKSRLGNRLLHPPVPGGLRRMILDSQSPEVLRSHCIEPSDLTLLRASPDAFIDARTLRLVSHVRDMVKRHAAWDETDRPPLRALWDDT